MYKKLIIIENCNFIERNIERIRAIAFNEKAVLVALSDSAFFMLKAHGLESVNFDYFGNADIYKDIYPIASNWGRNWYKPKGKDLTVFMGHSLGNFIEWNMIYFFSHFLRLFLSLKQIIQITEPGEIILIAPGNDCYSERCSKLYRADIDMLIPLVEFAVKSLNNSIKLRIIQLADVNRMDLKKSLKIFTRFSLSCLNVVISKMNLFANLNRKYKKNIVFFEGFHHFFNIMKSNELGNFRKIHLQKDMGLSIFIKLSLSGIRVESLKTHKKPTAYENGFDLELIKNNISEFFNYQGFNFLNCLFPRLEFLLGEYFQNVIYPDFVSFKNVLRKVSPLCVITENDTTYYEKMLTSIAKENGIITIAVQNGTTFFGDAYKCNYLSTHDFLPVTSDFFFSYGSINKEWFLNMDKACEDKVKVVGAARWDDYYRIPKKIFRKEIGQKKVLILLNDILAWEGILASIIRLSVFHEHIKKYIVLARNNPDIEFIIRPRDGQLIWNKIFKNELLLLKNIQISRDSELENLMREIDVVVGYRSTALVESLILRKPVISIDTNDCEIKFPLWDYGLSTRVKEFDELEGAMNKLLFCQKERDQAVQSIEKSIHLFNYRDNGLASNRIGEEINKAISEKTC